MKNYEYEENLDILYINNNFEKEKVVGSLVFGNIVIDIGENEKVLGIEIDCASKLFNFPSEQLNNLKISKLPPFHRHYVLCLNISNLKQKSKETFI